MLQNVEAITYCPMRWGLSFIFRRFCVVQFKNNLTFKYLHWKHLNFQQLRKCQNCTVLTVFPGVIKRGPFTVCGTQSMSGELKDVRWQASFRSARPSLTLGITVYACKARPDSRSQQDRGLRFSCSGLATLREVT